MPASKRRNATMNKTVNQGDPPSYTPESSSRACSHHATPDSIAASPPHLIRSEDDIRIPPARTSLQSNDVTKHDSAHLEQQGCEFLYLPAYSPDYNPIEEEALAKIKNLLFARPQPGAKKLW